MGRMLQILTGRLLRSRAGLALLLAALVLGIVGTARALSGPVGSGLGGAPPPLAVATPTIPDDGLLSPDASPSPTRIAGAGAPDAVARQFATAWVDHTGVSMSAWHARLQPHSTPELHVKLSRVDPRSVPADRVTGEPVIIPHASTIVEAVMPVDSGTLRLRLIVTDGRWWVDGVDWERS